ncbi:MAG: transglycosylase domain-containing protein [Spirochaetia bacterium]|jgi:penicillin-binding protein 1C
MGARKEKSSQLKPGGRLLPRALLMIGAPAIVTAFLLQLPWPALDAFVSDPAGTRILDRSGALLAVLPGKEGAFQVQEGPAEIPAACADIFLQLEDARFRLHPGVDLLAAARAIVDRAGSRDAQSGASTITMQLARLIAPHQRALLGKIVECGNALRIESRLTKDRILALYLNSLPFGRNTRGVGAASWTYFDAELSTLSRAQLLALAVIPRNPTLYDPFDQPDRLIAAARDANARKRLGIDPQQIDAAVRAARSGRPSGAAPHFARYVSQQVLDGRLRGSSGRLRTTLDLALNDYIQARVQYVLARYAAARVTNAAVVAIDNATGAVVGWVGSRDFSDAGHSGQIDGVLIRRQSASTLKPFLYARALEKGWTAATLLPDVAMVFGAADEEAYRPENFDKRSHGVVRLRTALASSLNVPAVYTLSRVGVADFVALLRGLGFALPVDVEARYGLGTAIGNAEVSLLELVHAFSSLPRGGTVADLALQAGMTGASHAIFDPFSAWMICNILSDPSARATGFGTRTYFRTRFPALFKSGTSSEFTNLWCVGATSRFTVGAWAGNFDGRAVINKTGSIVPTQIVADVLTHLTEQDPSQPREFTAPAYVVETRICTVTGKRATPLCTSTRIEYFRNTEELPAPCAYHAHPESRTTLLQESFLAPGDSVRIIFPVSGQVFYRDETLRSGAQGIPVVIAARDGQRVTVSEDGQALAAGQSLSSITAALTGGSHIILASSEQGSDRVFFEVR